MNVAIHTFHSYVFCYILSVSFSLFFFSCFWFRYHLTILRVFVLDALFFFSFQSHIFGMIWHKNTSISYIHFQTRQILVHLICAESFTLGKFSHTHTHHSINSIRFFIHLAFFFFSLFHRRHHRRRICALTTISIACIT